MTTSTLLSLLVAPVLFTYVDDAQLMIGRFAHRLGLLKRHHGAPALPQPASG